jgi:hypothetical protein
MTSTLKTQRIDLTTLCQGLTSGALDIRTTAKQIGVGIKRLKAGADDTAAGRDTAFTSAELCKIVQSIPGLSGVTARTPLTRGTTPLEGMPLRIAKHIHNKHKTLRGLASLLGKYCVLLCELRECPFSYIIFCDGWVKFYDTPVYSVSTHRRSKLAQTEPWVFMQAVKTGVARGPAPTDLPVKIDAVPVAVPEAVEIDPNRLIYPPKPYSEKTIALYEENRKFADKSRLYDFATMPSDKEIRQIIALSNTIRVRLIFTVRGCILII